MSLISIYIDDSDDPPVASAERLTDGRRYISLRAGGAHLSLPGFDAETVVYARAMAAALTTAADDLEAASKAQQAEPEAVTL